MNMLIPAGAVLLGFSFAPSAGAATFGAPDCTAAAVQAAIDMASDGDTVTVPAGNCTWTTKVTVAKSISLVGAGQGLTRITDAVTDDTMLAMGAGSVPIRPRLSGLTIAGSAVRNIVVGSVVIDGVSVGLGFRLDHVTFSDIVSTAVTPWGWVWGVIDHCTFEVAGGTAGWAVYFRGDTWGDPALCCGDKAWSLPDDFGTEKFVFVEDSTFNNGAGFAVNYTDSGGGARYVLRHNTFSGGFLRSHGTDSTPQVRGTRAAEVYANRFVNNLASFAEILEWRSGSLLFYDNVASGSGSFANGAALKCFRDNGNFWPTWGPCSGAAAWDQNLAGQGGYACLDQPGRGAGSLATSTPGGLSPPAWPLQALSPVYIWNNTGLNGGNQGGSTSSRIQLNRDYFLGPKPGYAAYPYPHPLVAGVPVGLQSFTVD